MDYKRQLALMYRAHELGAHASTYNLWQLAPPAQEISLALLPGGGAAWTQEINIGEWVDLVTKAKIHPIMFCSLQTELVPEEFR